jgi:hypothetical protein
MTHQLATLLSERLSTGLRRKSIVSPSKWAEEYRVMGRPFAGPWTFGRHPWLRGMHDSTAALNIGQKAAQMGFTETVLNVCFFYIDILGVDVLYILPSKTPDASDFSSARFDTALELSSHLARMFSDVRNVGHKKAGSANLYIRGAKSRSGLKSVPVGVIIFDEKDEMDQENITLARERQSGYNIKRTWEISTPTIDNFGINETFQLSSQNEFFVKCPSCSRRINLTFPDNIEICGNDHLDPKMKQTYLKCNMCNNKLPHETKSDWVGSGVWIEQYCDREIKGWGINQMYSPTIEPWEIAESFFKSQVNPADEQEFYNSKLGIPHVVEGARLTEHDLDECYGDHVTLHSNSEGFVTMGVDVGNVLHFEIDRWLVPQNCVDPNSEARVQVLAVGKVAHFEELDELMHRFRVHGCVIDMQPERRKAYEFACRHWGRVRLCFYGRGIQGKQIQLSSEEEMSVTVDRTSWLDLSLGRFRARRISLPRDLPKEYRRHMVSIVRVYEKDADGNPIGKYVKAGTNAEDHFCHARNYSEIALPLSLALGQAHNIVS